ncbi:MAG: hypothetical protein Q9160_005899 [Pyrenula sp. 1 TL-2023]
MGSMMEAPDIADSIVPKPEPEQDGYSSTSSTPEVEVVPTSADVAQVQKRKGGRKPIYATSEERKQRNRQAQAAFRERRTEYIKQLETTIKHQEETLHSLQQSHRTAADECLMLRYKNSLLERVLLEKGIDVQAELRSKGISNTPPSKPSQHASGGRGSPLQRVMINRQSQTKMQPPRVTPKLDTTIQSHQTVFSSHSPSIHHSTLSQTSSPSVARSPGYAVQGGISPPVPDLQAQQRPQPLQQQLPPQPSSYVPQPPRKTSFSTTQPQTQPPPSAPTSAVQSTYYPTTFQKHYDQLGKLSRFLSPLFMELSDMLDEPDVDESVDVDTFVPDFTQSATTNPPHAIGLQGQTPMDQPFLSSTGDGGGNSFVASAGPNFDPFDPMLDADPFGLTASMHFPTPYNFDGHQSRT